MKNMMSAVSGSRVEQGEPSPFTLEFFQVQGVGFRCMAYRDDEGKWREAFYNGELPGPIRILL